MARMLRWLRIGAPFGGVWGRHRPLLLAASLAMPGPAADSLKAGVRRSPSAASLRRGAGLAIRFAAQCLILCLLFGAGTVLAQAFALPVPGNLLGLLLLLLLLCTGVLRPTQLQDVASVVSKHLNFFFIPLVVGLMAWAGVLAGIGLALALSLVGSAVVGIAAAGLIASRAGGTRHGS